jgi:hypothetical protein
MKAGAGVARALLEEGPGSSWVPTAEKISLWHTEVSYPSSALHEMSFKYSFETNNHASSFPLIRSCGPIIIFHRKKSSNYYKEKEVVRRYEQGRDL